MLNSTSHMGFIRKKRNSATVIILGLLILLILLISISAGSTTIPLSEVVSSLFGLNEGGSSLIVLQFRLPRTLAALLVGAALALAGGLLQGVIRNPLAAPDMLGVTGGASVAVVAFMTLSAGAYSIHWVPLIAVVGAFIAGLINYVLAWRKGVSPLRLVLIGVGLSTALGALTTFLLISGPSHLASQILNWTTGSVYGTGWKHILALMPWLTLFIPMSFLFSRSLNAQSMGDEIATGLGIRVQRDRLLIMLCSIALAGAAVGIAGTLSFIGLIAPHMARRLVGSAHGVMLPVSAMVGAILLMLADLAGRMLFQPLDIPAGVFTAAIGAPFFLYLLYKRL
ncbi:iron ABC transporter permease [Paenibacillus sp. N3/727]|uniref:FecCD family ABC transporter permease n=1 Tax=Paenibacillus sp. N3/727 TaxID=2925845 RepID=UPI001F535EF4|nr:iron ABC transporter permease [Paenibacillus sp. N3/727]UNK18631.1 iron ABC transporter permease [Paenibacillus sp. N3/727]